MTKEEYAQLNYLLAKLKYCYAECFNNFNRKEIDDLIQNINHIQTGLLIIDNKNKRKVGDVKYENYDKSANER